MANRKDDGSRIEAAAAGVHAEERELDQHGTADAHVDAVDSVQVPATGPADERDVVPHAVTDTSDTGVGIADHGPSTLSHGGHGAVSATAHDAHDEHDAHDAHDDGHGGGHGADPNAGVVQGIAPTPAWVLTAVGIALLTIAICAVVAVLLHNAAEDGDGGAAGEPAHARVAVTRTVTGA
ncbi:MAG TPA: hypothetical protein VEZ46_13440 [Mycobacteriales bacterium]|jgi:hypothetical protein|nr:hypothetical protein [Mycobacteriales bacterium]